MFYVGWPYLLESLKGGKPDSSRARRVSGSDGKPELTSWQRLLENTEYPACVGLTRTGRWPNPVYECWNDCEPSRPAPLMIRYLPLKFIDWSCRGSHFTWSKRRAKKQRPR